MTFSPDRSSFDRAQEFPANIEAEQAILGALLMNNEAMAHIPSGFASDHFYEPLHREIYGAIAKGRAQSKRMDPVTVRSFMSPDLAGKKVGDMTVAQYLARLVSEAVTISRVTDFADAITGFYLRREAMDVGNDAQSAGTRAEDELDFINQIKECRERLTAIVSTIERRNETQETFRDMVDSTLDQTAEAMAGREPIGLDPGIPEMMQLTGPWQDGQLIVIGGDVKVGKSAAAWQCMFNIAEKHPFGGISGEMPVAQIMMREKARRTGISAKRQKQGRVSSVEIDELVKAGADIKRLKHIDIVSKQLTLDEIDERINRLQGEFGIKCFIVDHILKLAWSGKMEDADDFKKANKATSTLKNIAMKRNIPIVALTHINKNANDGSWGKTYRDRLMSAKRRRPTYKSMLGNIDKDVDSMIIVHQAYPAVAGMEPEENTADHELWEQVLSEVKGKAQFILALSRENEFPRSKDIDWIGESTSFGPPFRQTMNRKELF